MKILYVTVSFPFGAGETFLIPEIHELIRQGHQVLIVPLSPGRRVFHSDAKELVAHTRQAPLVSLGILRDATIEFGRHFHTAAALIRRLMTVRHFRGLVLNAAVIPKGLWLSRVAREWGADHIHAYWGSAPASAVLIAAECAGIPWSFTGHRHDVARDNLLAEKTRHAAFVRVISESGLKLLRSAAPDVAWKASVLHLGIPIREISIRAPNKERLTVLCPARLIEVKGHRYLIEAVAALSKSGIDVELWLAGDGESRRHIERQIRDLHMDDRVRLLGQMAHDELLRLYRDGQVDVVVLPSIDLGNGHHEGIPVALMEAMAHGIPVIGTETGGIPELIGGGSGLLIPPSDSQALTLALAELATNPVQRVLLGLAGHARVRQSFEITHTVDVLVRKFEESAPACRAAKEHEAQHIDGVASYPNPGSN
jgi:glycosyltransferase involved in cell wall biosynthesis